MRCSDRRGPLTPLERKEKMYLDVIAIGLRERNVLPQCLLCSIVQELVESDASAIDASLDREFGVNIVTLYAMTASDNPPLMGEPLYLTRAGRFR